MPYLRLLIVHLCLVPWIGAASFAQQPDESADPPARVEQSFDSSTSTDPEIPLDRLKIMLRPLMKEELETEAKSWLALVREKIREVGSTELAMKDLPADAPSEELSTQLIELRKEETALIERLHIVLNSLESKGGDITEQEKFLSAVSSLTEATDATSYWAAIIARVTTWLKSEEGGVYWLWRILFALIILLIFWLVSRIAGRATARLLTSQMKVSTLLEHFARRTAGGAVMVVGVLTAISVLGVEVGPLMAALGAGGFIVGFALQETLGSFASGLMIMVYRPFDVHDYVSVANESGTVQELNLVSTKLLTIDNKVVVIPNRNVWGQTIVNYTGRDVRRVDITFGIGYEDSIEQATKVLEDVCSSHKLVLNDPAVTVMVNELAGSSVNLLSRSWVKTPDYWTVYWDLLRQVKERFDAEGISIPYPQQDVHLHQQA